MDREQGELGYVVTREAWYSPALNLRTDWTEEIMLGRYVTDGGCEWEAALRWYALGQRGGDSPRLEAFSDAWGPDLVKLAEALVELGSVWPQNVERATPAAIRALLERLGYVDRTERTRKS